MASIIYAWDYYDSAGPLTRETTVLLPHGAGFQEISTTLTQQGVIENAPLFEAIAVAVGSGRNFKAGEYRFPPAITPHQVMSMLALGKVVIHKVTIPEGWPVREVVKLLASEPALTGELPADIKEGSLMPDTYHFMRGDKREDIIAKMQAAMRGTLDTLWAKRKAGLPITTPEEALTLASIVEKETGLANERGHVASVFINRLKIGMKLQSDPTVVYGLEKAMGAPLGRPLTTVDLQTATPYNTYAIPGLPPAPIANPGKAALEAVLNPPDTKDLYFVATGKGGHNFASTLEQHNRNVQAYRDAMDAKAQ